VNAPARLIQVDRLTLAPELASMRMAGDWLKKMCAAFGVPAASIARLDVCLHEALANVFAHGGDKALSDNIIVDLRVCLDQAQGDARLAVQDAGTAFDPLLSIPTSGAQSLATVEPGGLGIVMIRSNADLLEYKREHDLNHLTIGVRWKHNDT
jgi:serine/threonine-protein kinase RsbW